MYQQEKFDELLKVWVTFHDEQIEATAPIRAKIQELNDELAEVQREFIPRISVLEAEIRTFSIANAKTLKGNGAEARYRKGSSRVTYKWQTVDIVLGVLRDILPETAATLESARKESLGQPSVKIVRVE